VIRDERSEDAPAIRAVLEAAFPEVVEADLVDRLRATCQDRISLIAVEDNQVLGHILFTPVAIDRSDGPIIGSGLAPMAVIPEFQRKGIGSALVRAGIDRLRRSGCSFVVVVGHPEYYPRFGFVAASTYAVGCQWDGIPDEAFMILVLQSSITSQLAGVAKYRPEFDSVV
jgi:putative acetyltransferase